MIALGDRVKVAYETFTGGFPEGKCPAPRWEDAPSWIRDIAAVAYLQGKLDSAPPRPFFECPECGKDIADDSTKHATGCARS